MLKPTAFYASLNINKKELNFKNKAYVHFYEFFPRYSLCEHLELESSCKTKNLKVNTSSGNHTDLEGGVQVSAEA